VGVRVCVTVLVRVRVSELGLGYHGGLTACASNLDDVNIWSGKRDVDASPAASYHVDHVAVLAFRLCNGEACICSMAATHRRARTRAAGTRIRQFTHRRLPHSSKLTRCCATTAGTCCLASVLCASHLSDASCHRQPAIVPVNILIWECPSCKSAFSLGPAVAQSCEDYPARLNLSKRNSASRGTATRF